MKTVTLKTVEGESFTFNLETVSIGKIRDLLREVTGITLRHSGYDYMSIATQRYWSSMSASKGNPKNELVRYCLMVMFAYHQVAFTGGVILHTSDAPHKTMVLFVSEDEKFYLMKIDRIFSEAVKGEDGYEPPQRIEVTELPESLELFMLFQPIDLDYIENCEEDAVVARNDTSGIKKFRDMYGPKQKLAKLTHCEGETEEAPLSDAQLLEKAISEENYELAEVIKRRMDNNNSVQ